MYCDCDRTVDVRAFDEYRPRTDMVECSFVRVTHERFEIRFIPEATTESIYRSDSEPLSRRDLADGVCVAQISLPETRIEVTLSISRIRRALGAGGRHDTTRKLVAGGSVRRTSTRWP